MNIIKPNRSLKRGFGEIEKIYPQLNFQTREKKMTRIDDLYFENKFEMSEKESLLSQSKLEKQESTNNLSNDQLAKMLMKNNIFLNVNDALYHWIEEKGYYINFSNEYADKFIRQKTPDKYKYRINSNCIREIIQWIKSYINSQEENKLLSEKTHLIAFKNGVLNLKSHKFSKHKSKYFFTSVINAEYRSTNINDGDNFEKFIKDITHENHQLYLRIQELFGYIISEIRSVKYIPYLLGPKDTGKSIVLKLLEFLVGKESFTNLSFDQLNKPEYLANLLGKRLNTCGETSEFKLNKLDIFKKLSGGDHVTARPVYGQPVHFVNSAVLIFAGNHLPKINGLDKSNAFSQRIVLFPFLNQIPKDKQDVHLFEKLLKEKDYIVNWAIKGLIRWIESNYQFTSCPESEKISLAYSEQNNSIDTFLKKCCTIHPNSQIYKRDFEEAYTNYCLDIDVLPETKSVLHDYMKSLSKITYKKFRDGLGNNGYGYVGITLKEWS